MSQRERVILLREKVGMSKLQFAQLIGISKSKYYRFEEGDPTADLTMDSVGIIAEHFKVSLEWLLLGKGGDNPVFVEGYVSRQKYDEMEQRLISIQEELLKYQKREIEQLKKSGDVSDEK
ncbi:helix-turn-helix transcriptional regulator [Siphonobacter sp. SORGH_AS_0500]|uniref:helix-turn-helix domain-containing protein n=1 Tax=Siphonobacter sp. SORGH_AS_0500 TaxID=1864824 RepID=UPI002863EBAF|nr:helix-turn-helix transcriptional regulator [Siphonobacter sp. SORGH_AS_0500]MDR6196184.1 transcriptional regulator with XRE-family HTH domain [Siphonobacter sp. SORGH_AS_0500]